jgi:hypothetical protein
MKNISSQYQELQEGKMTKHQFLRNARMMFPSFVTNQNSFADSVAILKTKGMLVEGDAVKGTPDKEPTYDSPTPDAKTKYKKVEQSPEVDEQDGIYPATTLTDIPKIKANKKVKDTSSGLEPIKNNDTKNELKKVKVVKENIEPEKIKDAEKEITKNDASIQTMADKLGISQEELFKMLLKRLGGLKEYNSYDDEPYYSDVPKSTPNKDWDTDDDVSDRYDDYEEVDENEKSFDDVLKNFLDTDNSTEIKAYLKAKGRDAITKIKAKLPALKDQARQKLAKLMKIELDEVRAKQAPTLSIKERLKPAITKLVQEVLDEMGQ